ncbi:MAG: DUF3078 domain-containing protein [Bacteroidia bacterium]
MKTLLLFFIVIFTANVVIAQDAGDTTLGWHRNGITSISFNQISLSNWAEGGEGSLSLLAIFNYNANLRRENAQWDNSLDFGYGFVKTGDDQSRKSEDRMDLVSKYGYRAFKNWFYTARFNFKSQFAPGYNYPNDSVIASEFFSPAYILLAVGLDYKPSDMFSFMFSPATGKITIVNNQTLANAGAFGVQPAVINDFGEIIEPGENVRTEFGASVATQFQIKFLENIVFKSSLDLFNNYTDEIKENRSHIDVDWQTLLSFKINKYFSTTFATQLIYDHDIDIPIYEEINGDKVQVGVGPRTQFKQLFGATFSLQF